jgi:hypothetical protein
MSDAKIPTDEKGSANIEFVEPRGRERRRMLRKFTFEQNNYQPLNIVIPETKEAIPVRPSNRYRAIVPESPVSEARRDSNLDREEEHLYRMFSKTDISESE